jgi:hypothetical protein
MEDTFVRKAPLEWAQLARLAEAERRNAQRSAGLMNYGSYDPRDGD